MARRLWEYCALHICIFTCTITLLSTTRTLREAVEISKHQRGFTCIQTLQAAVSSLLFPWLHTQRECLRTEKTQSEVAVKNTDAEWNPQRDGLWISISEISQLCTQSQLRVNNNSITLIRWCPWNHHYSRQRISFLGWYFLKYIIFRWRWCRGWRDVGRTWLFNSLYDMRREYLPVWNNYKIV